VTDSRIPTPVLAVDANILIRAVLGRSWPIVMRVARERQLLTSADVHREVLEKLAFIKASPRRLITAESLLEIALAKSSDSDVLEEAARMLKNAVASRNGSPADAHLLAVAWIYKADIWSHDRDFAGTGWPSWSSANLLAALEASAA
jgi:predicted nucleic acid-binding protein